MGGLRQPAPRAGSQRVAGFPVVSRAGDPAGLVAPAPPGRRLAAVVRPDRPALVLGSTQRLDLVDQQRLVALGWTVAVRRSGGGPLVVAPGAQVWLDVFVPAGDPLADDDVGRSSRWLGELWSEALGEAGIADGLEVYTGPLARGPAARLACFAALGPGEVTWEGRKVVGLSQRRTREGSWLHTMALIENRQPELARLLALAPAEQAALEDRLAVSAGSLPLGEESIEARLVSLLAGA